MTALRQDASTGLSQYSRDVAISVALIWLSLTAVAFVLSWGEPSAQIPLRVLFSFIIAPLEVMRFIPITIAINAAFILALAGNYFIPWKKLRFALLCFVFLAWPFYGFLCAALRYG